MHQTHRTSRAGVLVLTMALLVAACSSDDGSGGDDDGPRVDPDAAMEPASFEVRPGVEQVAVVGAESSQPLTLIDEEGRQLLTLLADDDGQAVFAYIPDEHLELDTGSDEGMPSVGGDTLDAGDGYRVISEADDETEGSDPFSVMAVEDHPDEAFFDDQELEEGFGYIEMRDGVTLSANVRFPNEALYGEPPYPTVIEYSGYAPSRPDTDEPGSMIANLLGYATVGVNLRGSGCSGGTFDLFNAAQMADGYDMVEAVARQPWVEHNHVGMVGLSYSGITQLYVAASQPPSLAAITPLSVIEDPWRQLWPGGIFNAGFTSQWLEERNRQSGPEGETWVNDLIEGGDTTCEQNLEIRNQSIDFEEFGRSLEHFPPAAEDRRLKLLVPDIDVPVYLTGAFQDEQTGPRFGTMLGDFTGTDQKTFTLFNGRHPDGYSPEVLNRWYEFLELYVAERVPELPAEVRALAPAAFADFFGVEMEVEEDRFTDFLPDDLQGALAEYEAEPDVRVLFEMGAGMEEVPGAPLHTFEATFDEWPPAEAEARTWFFGPDGTLVDEEPDEGGVDAYEHDPEAGETSYTDEGAYDFLAPEIDFDWTRAPEGMSLEYTTEPFEEDLVVAGGGWVELWVDSDAGDPHVEVMVSLIDPDGTEWLVQHGLLDLSQRTEDEELSSRLHVEHTFLEEDVEPLPGDELVEARVPVMPVAQVFREGTRLKLEISTPGRNFPLWLFENPDHEPGTEHRVGWGDAGASNLVLGVLAPDAIEEIPDEHPPCPSLRGQVCRPYEPIQNRSAEE